MSPGIEAADAVAAAAAKAAQKAAESLLLRQSPEGFWWGDLTADATLEADWFLLLLWIHPPVNGVWSPPHRERVDRAVASILARQLPDGGFATYPGGPSEISASVKAYFALKLAGIDPQSDALSRLRRRILTLGGLQAANSYTKINLSLFGLYPREHVPTVPPELMLMRGVIYEMSSWTRAIVIPLALVQALTRTPRPVPTGFTLQEIVADGIPLGFPAAPLASWRNFFYSLDTAFKWWERRPLGGLREKAIRKAERWILDHSENSDGVAAIYPPMMYTIMALDALGYAPEHPARVHAERQFERLLLDQPNRFQFQPCFSVVWDTAIAAHAVGCSGHGSPAALSRCGDWLLSKEVRRKGDWAVKRPSLEPSGWYFEFANEFYPDIDDTAMVLLALQQTGASDASRHRSAVDRALAWLTGMQSASGGWAAFDADNTWEFLAHVPFADHNAMLDPACPDITGRVLEALCSWGRDASHPAVQRGVEFLIRTQEQDGSWYGRWGVNYIYGTFLALRGLRAAGQDDREAHILRAGEWIRSVQNADGGWGESCASYDRNGFVATPSTASQTAWAVLGLLASGDDTSSSVRKGVEFLAATQRADGTWQETAATGTGFPRVFYLTYHLYRDSFPLLALSEYVKVRGARRSG